VVAAAVVVAAVFAAARRDGGEATSSTTRIVVPATAGAATTTPPPSGPPPTAPRANDPAWIPPVATVAPTTHAADTAPPVATTAPTAVAPSTTASPAQETVAPTSPPSSADPTASVGGQFPITDPQADAFVRSYYDAVAAEDYDTSWAQLAPEFQRGKARSYDYYVDFWNDNDIEVETVQLVEATGDQAVVNVELRWNGSSTTVIDQFRLRPDEDGRPLIAGQSTVDGG
jgi:hypothetical protein